MASATFTNSDNSFLSVEEIEEILSNLEVGYKIPSDEFFTSCSKTIQPFIKQGVITIVEEEDLHLKNTVTCNVLGCRQIFQTIFAYQSHYNSLHRYLCSECKKSLPTPHLLDLHISEQHDSFFLVQSEKQPMFVCFLEECKHRSFTPDERKDHCIRAHRFPPNFRYDNFSLHNCTKKKHMKTENGKTMIDVEMETGKSELIKKRQNYTFGHQTSKGFLSNSYAKVLTKNSVMQANGDDVVMSPLDSNQTVVDLMESLPS